MHDERNKLKAIYVKDGEITMIFDQDLIKNHPTHVDNEGTMMLAELLQHIIDGDMDPTEREQFLNLSVRDFCTLCQNTAKNMTNVDVDLHINAPKIEVCKNPARYRCPNCSMQSLNLIDGHLSCATCGYDFGDIDMLPDFI